MVKKCQNPKNKEGKEKDQDTDKKEKEKDKEKEKEPGAAAQTYNVLKISPQQGTSELGDRLYKIF